MQVVFRPLYEDVWPTHGEPGINISCADGQQQKCFPVLAAWLSDHMEHVALQNINKDACPVCDVSFTELGIFMESPGVQQKRDHNLYQRNWKEYDRLSRFERRTAVQDMEIVRNENYFKQQRMKIGPNIFWNMQLVDPSRLHKPGLLHAIFFGMLDHLMAWINLLLKKYKWLDKFDNVWQCLPPYPSFSLPNKPYTQISQFQASALRDPVSMAQRQEFGNVLYCVSIFIEFSLHAQFSAHTKDSLDRMQKYLRNC
ncbi:hypothetical protein RUND412_008056 [Rhizina undulata]